MNLTGKQIIYGILSVLGLGLTWYHNLQFMSSGEPSGIVAFVAGGLVNHAAASLTMDVLIAALTFQTWMVIEARKLGMRHWWVYFVLTPFIALAFAFPLFLFMRERKLAELEKVY